MMLDGLTAPVKPGPPTGKTSTLRDIIPKRKMTAELRVILADRTVGATEIARRALAHIAAGGVKDPAEAVRLLTTARPDFAVLVNLGCRLNELARSGGLTPEAVSQLLAELEGAAERAAERAAHLLSLGADVVTASYSSQVVRAVELYRGRGGGRIWVWVTDPQDPVGRRTAAVLGAEVITSLEGLGQPVGLIGADAVFVDGSVINGSPSLGLAEALAGRGAPLYVVATSFKLLPGPPHSPMEPGFELVPARLIAAVVLEEGPWRPASA